ncbi:malto-oligosyltrehalose synthase [Mucilaginibacter xinganensis]|uniref:4-alpha-glucanotransferase n=1 Tax=Mucilaginibacter xinganensis TaxID=1234841 RepID=A0A223NV12_9SPHI|nr:malto-oligosyltrehalose synthase [Mucilaginibacter xinganensis]ASU33361.1 4-alpha-glucanotransferase [Mucilaginibacter xinganensis]
MYNPVSTYRIQFHKDFNFSDFEAIIPYLHQLGIKTIYASPIFKATPGSTHGYDITDANQVNPEIGTLKQLIAISKKLKAFGMGWLQDIVPNHMAFHPGNGWLMDVLEHGRHSAYSEYFDILWDSPVCDGKIMVPFLGAPLEDVINDGALQIILKNNKLHFSYGEHHYPLNQAAHQILLQIAGETKEEQKKFPGTLLKKINKDGRLLHQIAGEQYYQLCYWQETDRQINFRRFFTVNGLICLNMQRQEVFDDYHRLIKQLLDKGVFQGLRVDHVDGLFDPEQYLDRLRTLAGEDTYIIVEKILEAGEDFPANWPVQGNTGYDFLATVNNLFTEQGSKSVFAAFYKSLTGDGLSVKKMIRQKKSMILHEQMAGELDNLYSLFVSLELAGSKQVDAAPPELIKACIAELLIRFPVYRYYGNVMPLPADESDAVRKILEQLEADESDLKPAVKLLKEVILEQPTQNDDTHNQRVLKFYQRCMQFTGPLMAKGVEDTLMYTYNRFIDHNEVGDSPQAFGISTDGYHRQMTERQIHWPLSVNATSTHDTKRGEDVRARLNVLTDLAGEWVTMVAEWREINASLINNNMPDANDEYFIYQTITGALPMPGQDMDDFVSRVQEYLVKALREGKENSGWAEPYNAYETDVKDFIANILRAESLFMQSFLPFHRKIADYGIMNSMAQVLLKYTSPGMPDIYQGTELWDLSLVDPDNRRPVDYALRQQLPAGSTKELWANRYNAQIKQKLIQSLLIERSSNPELFLNGTYIPLKVKGKCKNNVLAFARRFETQWRVMAVPLHWAALHNGGEPLDFDWDNTRIILPPDAPMGWTDLLNGSSGFGYKGIGLKELFGQLPVVFLKLDAANGDRRAGILMHITSLPSAFGIGDMGPEAFKFIDFLSASRQKYWQMLPVNPVDKLSGFSPYSSSSGMAGNILLISPERLAASGLLEKHVMESYSSETGSAVDFKAVIQLKSHLFDLAYQNFLDRAEEVQRFVDFKNKEASWLDDFALYDVLKESHENKPWHQWPATLRDRDKKTIKQWQQQENKAIDKIKWLQFVFAQQWAGLRDYSKLKGITLFGDMPFYVGYGAVDVWANPHIFNADGIAGVPPDYFSVEGQLWGMPVYRWGELKKTGYEWWLKRIKKNLEYFDLIRLDHFRAFDEYWEVPAGEETAVNGEWKKVPGIDFFNAVKKELGCLPFVAEDLGDITKSVYELRDHFDLPGMRVVQFAFDENLPYSSHIPHNYTINCFAYTGTHDNNTVTGWYEHDITDKERKRIDKYLDTKSNSETIAAQLIKLIYASVARTVIVPVQDVLGLGAGSRINTPSLTEGNWTWRLKQGALTKSIEKKLRKIALYYNR